LLFDGIDIRFSDLDYWIPYRVFNKYAPATQCENQHKKISIDTHHGFIVEFIENSNESVPGLYIKITSTDHAKKHIDDYFRVKRYLQDFLCFVLERLVYTLSIMGTISGNQSNIRTEIFTPEYMDSFVALSKYDRQLLLFEHLADQISIYLEKWINIEIKLREVIALYTSFMESPSIYLEIRFQMIIYALEAYYRMTNPISDSEMERHKSQINEIVESCPNEYKGWLTDKLKFSYEPSLRHRLKDLIRKFENTYSKFDVSGHKVSLFINRVVNTRNYLTHNDPNSRTTAITDRNELNEVTDQLIGLLQICLLTEILTPYQMKKIFQIFDLPVSKAMGSLPVLHTYHVQNGREYIEDSNPKDLYHLSRVFEDFYCLSLDMSDLHDLTSMNVVDIVEIVEEYLLRPPANNPVYRDSRITDVLAIRTKDQSQIVHDLLMVAEKVTKKYRLGKPEEVVVKALYMWYGCICIDKACRIEDIHMIAPQNRMDIYEHLIGLSSSNSWIRKGFTSARFFRRTSDQERLKDYTWIPHDSIYWTG
jgi:hypothetical protein